jgi:hypothetical protein
MANMAGSTRKSARLSNGAGRYDRGFENFFSATTSPETNPEVPQLTARRHPTPHGRFADSHASVTFHGAAQHGVQPKRDKHLAL